MKRWVLVLGLLGLAGAIALIVRNNAGEVFQLVATQGFGLVAVVLFHAVPLCLSATAWRNVGVTEGRPAFSVFFAARALREGVNDLLPAAQIGGVAASVRVLSLAGWRGPALYGAAFVDVTLESASQVIFVLIGVVILLIDGRAPDAAMWSLMGAGLLALGVAGFVIVQYGGGIGMGERFIRRAVRTIGGRAVSNEEPSDAIARDVAARYRKPGLVACGFALHLLCWIAGIGEIWLIMNLLGAPCTWGEAFILESLGTAIRSAAFMIPAGIGVQEGGFLLLGSALGFSAPVSLALSLTKRVREVVIGSAALILWQVFEGRRFARGLTQR